MRRRILRWGVPAFIAFHLVVIFVFSIPVEIFPFPALRGVFAPYMRCMGLTETWNMFANPVLPEQYLKALVITPGQKIQTYSFPRMEELSYFERYRKERYRKFIESVLCEGCSGLWPDIAREVARRTVGKTNQPTQVILIKYESPVDPKTGATGDDAHAKGSILIDQTVMPEDLR